MTWVVGTTTPFGYGIGLSDIRVTFSDGTERDCLQKIYPVGPFIAAGFAGAVAIGFAMVNRLRELLHDPSGSGAWDPVAVSQWWPADAREVFERFPETERKLQSQVILIGAHPTEHNGAPQWPRCHVYTFSSPSFEAVEVKAPSLAAIGCFNILQGEQGTPGGMATMLAINLTALLKDTQPRGISSHLHYCWVYRGRIVIKTNDHVAMGPWTRFYTGVDSPENLASELPSSTPDPDPRVEHFVMPRIATSLGELDLLLRKDHISSVCALA